MPQECNLIAFKGTCLYKVLSENEMKSDHPHPHTHRDTATTTHTKAPTHTHWQSSSTPMTRGEIIKYKLWIRPCTRIITQVSSKWHNYWRCFHNVYS